MLLLVGEATLPHFSCNTVALFCLYYHQYRSINDLFITAVLYRKVNKWILSFDLERTSVSAICVMFDIKTVEIRNRFFSKLFKQSSF